MKKTIAILYKDSNFISKDKMKVKNYLLHDLNLYIENDRNKIEYDTEKVIIYWVDVTIRSLNKFFKECNPDVIISAINKEYWKTENKSLFEKIKKEIDTIHKEITIYEVVYNYEDGEPSRKIKKQKMLDVKLKKYPYRYFLTEEDAIEELCINLEMDNLSMTKQIEYREKASKEEKEQIEINERAIEKYENTYI